MKEWVSLLWSSNACMFALSSLMVLYSPRIQWYGTNGNKILISVQLWYKWSSQYFNMTNKRRWGNGWVHYGPQMHACLPCLLWSYCARQQYNGMVWMAMKSRSVFNSDINEVFLIFCTYSQYCNMTKIIWGNGWVHCGPQMHACSLCLIWSYCNHQRSNSMVRNEMESCFPFNSDINEVLLLFCTYSQYCNMTKRRWGNGVSWLGVRVS